MMFEICSFKSNIPFLRNFLVAIYCYALLASSFAFATAEGTCTDSICYERLKANIAQLKGKYLVETIFPYVNELTMRFSENQDELLAFIDPLKMAETVKYARDFEGMNSTISQIVELLEDLNIDGDTIKNVDELIEELESLMRSLDAAIEEVIIKIDDADRDANMTVVIFERFDKMNELFGTFKRETENILQQHGNIESARDAQSKFERAADDLEKSRRKMESVINVCTQLEAIEFDWDNHENNEDKLNKQQHNVANGEVDALLDAIQEGVEKVEKAKERYNGIFETARLKNDNATKDIDFLGDVIQQLQNNTSIAEVKQWLDQSEKMKDKLSDIMKELEEKLADSKVRGKLVKQELESVLNIRFEETSDELQKLIDKILKILDDLDIPTTITPTDIEEKLIHLSNQAGDIE